MSINVLSPTSKMESLKIWSYQKHRAFKIVIPERLGFVFHERFIYFCSSDFTYYYTVGINELYIYMHIFSEAVPLAPSSALFGITW